MARRLILIFLIIALLAGAGFAQDLRSVKLKKFLDRYPWSPLRGHEHEIVYCADLFGIDYRLYVAIAGAESTYGKRYIKQSKNLTGYNNGVTPFSNIYQNIYETSKLIGTKHYYKKYRATKNIKDLVLVYKAVPPFEHYIRNLRYALDSITAMSVEKERAGDALKQAMALLQPSADFSKARMIEAMREPLYTWHSVRYDRYPTRKRATIGMKVAGRD